MTRIDLVGSGLCGPLAASVLAARGFEVHAWDRRPDPRVHALAAGRSINLALSVRGLAALDLLGLREEALRISLPMKGRLLHDREGQTTFVPYGSRPQDAIRSISRGGLNQLLLSHAEGRGASLHFSRRLKLADPAKGRLVFQREENGQKEELNSPHILGCDGSASVLRAALEEQAGSFRGGTEWLEHGYKELEMPPAADGGFRMREDCLHIWPRGEHMLIALPNLDRSFTCTLFMPHEGWPGFNGLEDPGVLETFFREEFPDAFAQIPDLCEQYARNPVGKLGTVRCAPWHLRDRLLLIGDAAHAVVPFFGQGMNCAFEDVSELDRQLEAFPDNLGQAFARTFEHRKENADAIARMALENYVEMRDTVADPLFQLMKQVEHRLEAELPDRFLSRYSMVSFSRIPYRLAWERGEIQAALLRRFCRGKASLEEVDLAAVKEAVNQELQPLATLPDH